MDGFKSVTVLEVQYSPLPFLWYRLGYRGVCVSVELILDRRRRNRKTISFPSFFLDAVSPVDKALIIGRLSFLSIFQPVWKE